MLPGGTGPSLFGLFDQLIDQLDIFFVFICIGEVSSISSWLIKSSAHFEFTSYIVKFLLFFLDEYIDVWGQKVFSESPRAVTSRYPIASCGLPGCSGFLQLVASTDLVVIEKVFLPHLGGERFGMTTFAPARIPRSLRLVRWCPERSWRGGVPGGA